MVGEDEGGIKDQWSVVGCEGQPGVGVGYQISCQFFVLGSQFTGWFEVL